MNAASMDECMRKKLQVWPQAIIAHCLLAIFSYLHGDDFQEALHA